MRSHECCGGSFADLGSFGDMGRWFSNPVTVLHATDLDRQIVAVLTAVRDAFHSYGLQLNMQAGKTELVCQYHGPDAVACRHRRFVEHAGQLDLPDGSSLHVVGQYQHLGTVFSQSLSLQSEMNGRIGKASAAFRQMSRTIFTNKKLAPALRLQLLESLVLSIVFYGSGTWPLLNHRMYTKLAHVVVQWQRRIAADGFWRDDRTSDSDFQARWQLPTLSARLAKHRLLYAFKMVKHAPQDLITCITAEDASASQSPWCSALRHAIDWMRLQDPQSFAQVSVDTPDALFQWLHDHYHDGPSLVRRLAKRAVKQDQLVFELKQKTQQIYEACRLQGVIFDQVPAEPLSASNSTFSCTVCGQGFGSVQGLQAHRWRKHQLFSDERKYIYDTTCRECNRCFWTVQRLQQHLRWSRQHLLLRVTKVFPAPWQAGSMWNPSFCTWPLSLASQHGCWSYARRDANCLAYAAASTPCAFAATLAPTWISWWTTLCFSEDRLWHMHWGYDVMVAKHPSCRPMRWSFDASVACRSGWPCGKWWGAVAPGNMGVFALGPIRPSGPCWAHGRSWLSDVYGPCVFWHCQALWDEWSLVWIWSPCSCPWTCRPNSGTSCSGHWFSTEGDSWAVFQRLLWADNIATVGFSASAHMAGASSSSCCAGISWEAYSFCASHVFWSEACNGLPPLGWVISANPDARISCGFSFHGHRHWPVVRKPSGRRQFCSCSSFSAGTCFCVGSYRPSLWDVDGSSPHCLWRATWQRTSTIALQFTCMGPPWPFDAWVKPAWCRFKPHAAQLIVGSPDLFGRRRQYHGASIFARWWRVCVDLAHDDSSASSHEGAYGTAGAHWAVALRCHVGQTDHPERLRTTQISAAPARLQEAWFVETHGSSLWVWPCQRVFSHDCREGVSTGLVWGPSSILFSEPPHPPAHGWHEDHSMVWFFGWCPNVGLGISH